ncbi:hypothetical protein RFI_34163 [Reticulomyxa filosa]|uniref:SEC7 domain-containing protein n=1 Tax=Reticulomyxa filosa TaxID=46433 RepID=X6LR68_RETFI|nr:hypothetical protein RFI_34163 [Reticulomyxa filosa]|eukprot:ETO03245.1 hypothetical protein RFI_34163 [Reticulomyxa filosa]
MAMATFKTVVQRFKQQLKSEIGILFDSFLLLINSPNSTYTQKLEVLKTLEDISADGNTTVSLFLNYDCSDEAASPKVFQRIISTIENIGQSKLESRDWINPEEADDLKHAALSCFVRIIEGLLQWKDHMIEKDEHMDTREESRSKSGTLTCTITESSALPPTHSHPSDLADDSHPSNDHGLTGSSPDIAAETTPMASSTTSVIHKVALEKELSLTNIPSATQLLHKSDYQEKFERHTKKQATLRTGVVKFNIEPKHVCLFFTMTLHIYVKGIKYLVENGFLKEEVPMIAEFLLTQSHLSKIQIGEYLGGEKPFNQQVMHEYINRIHFEQLDFVDALRTLCASFLLPGEGQKIDRILQRFAARYCEQNSDVFPNADIAYILAYSCILLHVNVHSPKVKKKMTKDEFVSQTKGATKDETLSTELLSQIYDNIVAKEMKLPGHSESDDSRDKEDRLSSRQKLDLLRVQSRRMIKDIKEKIKMTRQQKIHERFVDVHDVELYFYFYFYLYLYLHCCQLLLIVTNCY